MAQFTRNNRIDPYKNFKFRVYFAGIPDPIAGMSKVGALKRTTETVSHRDGGDNSTPRHSPGTSKFEPITFERGVTHDPAFEEWANLVYSTNGDAAISLANFRRDLRVDLLNEQGVVAKSYLIFRCWVSEYTALPELDANANATAIEMATVQNEGWVRDLDVREVAET
ncbi:phage tail protein [Tateyamaria armeniaca]|uniref:Phage tail protein n=1 Tax=Tateyamaria armeniaca TaxID=2518930 RepID=A0ABW8USJ6_9RHOB